MNTESAESKAQRLNTWNSIFWGIIALAVVTVVATIAGPPQSPGIRESIQVSSVVFLCSCLGFWLGLGQGYARYPVSVLATLVIGGCFGFHSIQSGRGDGWLFFVFSYLILGIVTITLWVLRCFYGRLEKESLKSAPSEALQFSVRQVMIWTACIAIVLTVFRQLNLTKMDMIQEVAFLIVSTTCFFSAMTVLQISVWLSRRISVSKVFSLIFVVTVFLIFCGVVLDDDGGFWAVIGLTSQLAIGATMYCLRQQDFRFVRLADR